jgi:beta-lactamase class A
LRYRFPAILAAVTSTDAGGAEALRVELDQLFDAAGVDGFLHVRDIGSGASVGHHAEDRVLLASTRKIALLLELERRLAAGEWDPTERLRVSASSPKLVGFGIPQLQDEVEISLRDLAVLMISVSDNQATGLIAGRVGAEHVNATLRELGFADFVFRHPTYDLAAHDPTEPFGRPELGANTTAAALSGLLAAIWRDEAGTPAVCAEVRRVLATQVWPHRLRSGFPDEVRVAGKTGSFRGWKNEAGVAEFPDGGSYAIAVFTRLRQPPEEMRTTAQDLVIGSAAAAAVAWLRGRRPA